MTTAYAQPAPQEARSPMSRPRLRLVSSAPAQGREALKMSDNMRAISVNTLQGHSAESGALKAAVRDLAESVEAPHGGLPGANFAGYNHVPLKAAFSVKATYKLRGNMPPRQLPEDE